jgi:hypothetical protein
LAHCRNALTADALASPRSQGGGRDAHPATLDVPEKRSIVSLGEYPRFASSV